MIPPGGPELTAELEYRRELAELTKRATLLEEKLTAALAKVRSWRAT